MRSLRIRQAKWAARLPFTNTFDTVSASERSRVNSSNSASAAAVIVADPERRLIETLYSRASS